MTFKSLTLASIATLALTTSATANPTLPNGAEQALQDGDAFVQVWIDKVKDDGAIDILTAIDINAKPNTIWSIMTDCDSSMIVVPDMKSCEVLQTAPDGSWDIRKQKTKINFMIKANVTFRSDYVENESIQISKVDGDMKIQDGMWALSPQPNGKTRVTYRARSAPNFPVSPKKLKKGAQKDLPDVLKRLRTLAETRASE